MRISTQNIACSQRQMNTCQTSFSYILWAYGEHIMSKWSSRTSDQFIWLVSEKKAEAVNAYLIKNSKRERQTETDRDKDRETDRQTETDTERQRADSERETDRDRERERLTETKIQLGNRMKSRVPVQNQQISGLISAGKTLHKHINKTWVGRGNYHLACE